VFGGFEDGVVRIYDLRKSATSSKSSAVMTYVCHDKWVSQIKANSSAENVFLTSGYDGKIKMWDLRNPVEPLSILKRTTTTKDDKIFALAWNGASQILSGGADSHVSVHEIAEASL
jgi:WD40 repeat protein